MTHRTFKDRLGRVWDVWQVHPSAAERRFVQRRKHKEDPAVSPKRRSGRDRRAEGETSHHREPVAAEFASGWLCFETTGEKRRLAPIPHGWDRADNATIEQMCSAAKPVTRRPSGSIRGIGGA